MHKALSFVRLDFITVKPYFTLKNLIIFSVLPLVFVISFDTGATAIGMFMMLATMYVSYPFAVGEQNGIDTLYPTLSIKRGTVVLGRYLFALVFDLCAGILAFIYSFAALTVMGRNFDALESLAVTLVLFIVFSIIQAIQLPIYFKLGYAKAKLLAYLPFIGFFVVAFVLNSLLADGLINQATAFFEWIVANPIMTAALTVAIWLGIMIISYQISLALYKKRDF